MSPRVHHSVDTTLHIVLARLAPQYLGGLRWANQEALLRAEFTFWIVKRLGSSYKGRGGQDLDTTLIHHQGKERNNSSRTTSSPRARHPRGSKPLAVSPSEEQSRQSPPSRGASSQSPQPRSKAVSYLQAVEQAVSLPSRGAKPSVTSKPWSKQSVSPAEEHAVSSRPRPWSKPSAPPSS